MKIQSSIWGAALALVISAGSASAGLVYVSSYDMNNGSGVAQSSFLNYFDGNYTGSGNKNVANAPLSGGVGALTDGFIATLRWDNPVNTNLAGTGTYVGWRTDVVGDPLITFNFNGAQTVQQLDLWVDASNNGYVGAPTSIFVNGSLYVPTVSGSVDPNCPADNQNQLTCSLKLTVVGNWIGESITVKPVHGPLPWIMVSEVQFSNAVPEPSTWALMLLGFAGVGYAAYRRSRKGSTASAAA